MNSKRLSNKSGQTLFDQHRTEQLCAVPDRSRMRRIMNRRWLKSMLASSSLAFMLGTPASIAFGMPQLQIGAEGDVPEEPSPAIRLSDEDAWDMDEEFQEVDGVTPLLRGPLHEAYAERFSDDFEDPITITKTPPDLIDEQPPEVAPEGENFVWIPGYWGWDLAEEDFVWVSGVWRKVPPKHQWVPGYWAEVEGGWQWVSGFWSTAAEETIVYLPAPPETLDVGPSSPAPGDNYFWIPGSWNFVGGDYSWRAGYWGVAQNDWVWMPHRYVWTPSGYIYRRGYWDYRLPARGVVFTPVHFRPGFSGVYRPAYTVQVNPLMLANLFIAPGFSQYYYGNYFGYSGRRTIHPWASYYRFGHDPFLSYYAHQRRHENWLTNLNRLERQIAVNPHLQSQIRVSDQLRLRHDPGFRSSSIDTLMRVSNARRLVESSNPSFKPPVNLRVDRDVHTRFPKDKVIDPMRDFERKRRDLEKAVTDIDRDRGTRPGRGFPDRSPGNLLKDAPNTESVGKGPSKGPGIIGRGETLELKELKLQGRDDFRGRPPVPRDLQVDRRSERISTPESRVKPPIPENRDKLREERTRELDKVLGGRGDEKLTPEQLRDVRRDLLGGSSPRRDNIRDNIRRDGSEPIRSAPADRPRPTPGSPNVDAPARPKAESIIRPDRPNIDRPNIDRPNIDRPNIDRPRIDRPNAVRPTPPKADAPRIETPTLQKPKVEVPRPEIPRAESANRGTPRLESPKVESLRTRPEGAREAVGGIGRAGRAEPIPSPSAREAIRDRVRPSTPSARPTLQDAPRSRSERPSIGSPSRGGGSSERPTSGGRSREGK